MARFRTPHPALPVIAAANDLASGVHGLLSDAPADKPLPTTRELGKRFGVANTTVFRLLRALKARGEIWQHPANGRYYPSTARALLERPKPTACLIRRLELCSQLYRELLEGISAGCGERNRTMLLWHDDLLVNHPDPNEPPRFAPAAQQHAILEGFLDRHGGSAEGFVLDHVWSDETLRAQCSLLKPGVVLFRSCALDGLSNVAADFRGGALKALVHLLARGFEQIIPIGPFTGDPAVAEFDGVLHEAALELDCHRVLATAVSAADAVKRQALIERLRRTTLRTALLCPEDNVAALVATEVRDAGLRCPENVGVLSVMGTDSALKSGLSCLRFDFRLLGRLAVEALSGERPVRHMLPSRFVAGSTT